jgi:hypothetical protein
MCRRGAITVRYATDDQGANASRKESITVIPAFAGMTVMFGPVLHWHC